jgi:heptosyltransferase III
MLLTTPTVAAIKARHPAAEISLLVREGTHSVLEGCPAINRIFQTCPPEKNMRKGFSRIFQDLEVLKQLRALQFDYVFELGDSDRGRFFAIASGAHMKVCGGNGKNTPGRTWSRFFDSVILSNWKTMHQVEKDFHAVKSVLNLGDQIPKLVFEASCDLSPLGIYPSAPYLFIHPVTRWNRKKWPFASWQLLLQKIVQSTTYHLIISSGPDTQEREMASLLASSIGPRATFTGGALHWREMAWLIRRADQFIGVDTAAMHLSAACGCPTVALFGPSKVSSWHPWRVTHQIIRPVGLEDADLNKMDGNTLMSQIKVEAVYEAAMKLLDSNKTDKPSGNLSGLT